MKTYKIQYLNSRNGQFRTYKADDDTDVEFIQKSHAETVARDLASGDNTYPSSIAYWWLILDSEGNATPLEAKNDI